MHTLSMKYDLSLTYSGLLYGEANCCRHPLASKSTTKDLAAIAYNGSRLCAVPMLKLALT